MEDGEPNGESRSPSSLKGGSMKKLYVLFDQCLRPSQILQLIRLFNGVETYPTISELL